MFDMIDVVKILACGVVYFLGVYLVMIRRESQPVTPWLVCISAQVLCSVFFDRLKGFFNGIFSQMGIGNENLGMVVASAILFFGNMILIFIMFGVFMSKKKAESNDIARRQEEFRVAPVNILATPVPDGQTAKSEVKTDITLDFIKKMIADGRTEEAKKYLKMLAYYGKDEQAKLEASALLANLTRTEAQA